MYCLEMLRNLIIITIITLIFSIEKWEIKWEYHFIFTLIWSLSKHLGLL